MGISNIFQHKGWNEAPQVGGTEALSQQPPVPSPPHPHPTARLWQKLPFT